MTQLSQFIMQESVGNICVDHIDGKKGHICHSSKKSRTGKKDITSNSHILVAKSVEPSQKMELSLA